MAMVPVRCSVHEEVRDKLKEYAQTHDISMSVIIRKLCYWFDDQSETTKNKLIGKY